MDERSEQRDFYARYVVDPGPKRSVSSLKAAVTTDSAIATETMVQILSKGGNAIDAAIAGAMVQAAVEPHMTNLAGLVTSLVYEAKSGKILQLDSPGIFPSGIPPFKPVPSWVGAYATMPPSAVIPGFMPGMGALHRRFGRLSWGELCEPAIDWAERGHPVSSYEYGVNIYAEKFITYFPEGRKFHMPRGFLTPVGEIFVPRGLADTLRRVADEGPNYMIRGAWGSRFVKLANQMGWMIRSEHLLEAVPRWLEPLRFRHGEYEIASLAPPQAQGVFVAVTLGVLKHLGVKSMTAGSANHLWALGQALRLAARHWEFVQDGNVFSIPIDEVLDDGYHAHLAKLALGSRPRVDLTEHIRLSGTIAGSGDSMSTFYGGAGLPTRGEAESKQPSGSCEIAVVDSEGNWVQMLNTLQGSGIPGMVLDGVPMVGSHATFGESNSPIDAFLVKGAAGRCVSGNTFVLRHGRPILSAGSPGHVHCTVPQVLSNVLDFAMDPYQAVDAPRMLPLTEGRSITIEDRVSSATVGDLAKLGVRVFVTSGYDSHMGSFSVIGRDDRTGTYTAVEDPRRGAVAGGLPSSPK